MASIFVYISDAHESIKRQIRAEPSFWSIHNSLDTLSIWSVGRSLHYSKPSCPDWQRFAALKQAADANFKPFRSQSLLLWKPHAMLHLLAHIWYVTYNLRRKWFDIWDKQRKCHNSWDYQHQLEYLLLCTSEQMPMSSRTSLVDRGPLWWVNSSRRICTSMMHAHLIRMHTNDSQALYRIIPKGTRMR